MYPIPLSWTLDGFSSPGGQVISEVDQQFIAARYPFSAPPVTGNVMLSSGQVDSIIDALNKSFARFDSTEKELNRMNDLTRKFLGR